MKNLIYIALAILVSATSCSGLMSKSSDAVPTASASAKVKKDSLPLPVSGAVRITLISDSISSLQRDEAYIGIDSAASALYVRGEDAPYLQGAGKESFSTLSSDGVHLAVNMQPLFKKGITIKLSTDVRYDGNYFLLLNGNTLPDNYKIKLTDNYTHLTVNLVKHDTYAFTILKSDPTTYGDNRFTVTIK